LIGKLESLELHARRILSKAEKAQDYRSAIAAVRKLRGTVDSIARITGAIRDRGWHSRPLTAGCMILSRQSWNIAQATSKEDV
jgi:hypothetical protein